LEGDIWKAQTFWDYFTVWRMSWSGMIVSHNTIRMMEFFGLVPKGTFDVGESLKIAAASLVRSGQQKVWSTRFVRNSLTIISALHAHVPCREPKTQQLKREPNRSLF
jgi:hypothetical protein